MGAVAEVMMMVGFHSNTNEGALMASYTTRTTAAHAKQPNDRSLIGKQNNYGSKPI